MTNFQQYKSGSDLDFINELFAADGNSEYRELKDSWFKAGINDAFARLPIQKDWCEPYLCGYRVAQAEMEQLAELTPAIEAVNWGGNGKRMIAFGVAVNGEPFHIVTEESPQDELEQMAADLAALREGKVEPLARLTQTQMDEIEAEHPGDDFCVQPWNY